MKFLNFHRVLFYVRFIEILQKIKKALIKYLVKNIFLFLDETPKIQHFSAEVVLKEYCQAVKVLKN